MQRFQTIVQTAFIGHVIGSGLPDSALLDVADIIDCGVVDQPSPVSLSCGDQAQTDCASLVHVARGGVCPESCPYVAPHPYLSCVFSCNTEWSCSLANAGTAYPNNVSHICEPCNIVGCRRCSSKDTCLECFDNFVLQFGGRVCGYVWDDRAQHGVHAAAAFFAIAALLVLTVVSLIDRCSCCGPGCLPQEADDEDIIDVDEELTVEGLAERDLVPVGQSKSVDTDLDATAGAIKQGRLHRLRCKVKNLEVRKDGSTNPKDLLNRFKTIPFWVDLQSQFLVGVGLPLFHQWYFFLVAYSIIMCAGTAIIYYRSELSGMLTRTGLDHASAYILGESAMSLCALNTNSDYIGEAMKAYGTNCAIGYCILWLIGLVLSLLFAARQKLVTTNFHKRHSCLAEFVLNVEGFPPEAIDEERILAFLREVFGCEAIEVSVCYDYRDRRDKVHEMLEKILVREDVRAGTYDASLATGLAGFRGLGLSEEEKATVRSWLDPCNPNRLRNAGSVFVIFPHNYDLQLAQMRFEEAYSTGLMYRSSTPSYPRNERSKVPMLPHSPTPEWLPAGPLRWVDSVGQMHPLTVRDVVCEPPEVNWDYLGLETSSLILRALFGAVVIIISFATITAIIFIPLAAYSISFVNQAGSLPTGVMMTILGMLVMSANWIIGLLHISVTSQMGFSRRDREGLLIFKAFSFMCLVSFLFNVAITIFPESSSDPVRFLLQPLQSGRVVTSLQDISFQLRASVHLFHVLVPGSLFIGYLLFPLQGFVWPLVSTQSFLRCWYRGFGPTLTAREAEKAFEPLGMSFGHDYMGHIVQPISCSLTLFFASSVTWQTFACLAAWSIFMMIFSRYMHLRSVRRCYFSTNRMDADALFSWAAPLSMVLAASAWWAARTHGWPLHIVPVAWTSSVLIYTSLLVFCVQPLSPPKEQGHAAFSMSYEEVRAKRFYDWHNCNPIKVLLSHCLDDEDPITPFETGKEYLQAGNADWRMRMEKVSSIRDSKRRDTRRDTSLGDDDARFFSWLLAIPEVENIVEQPLDFIGKQLAPPKKQVSTPVTRRTSNRNASNGSKESHRQGSAASPSHSPLAQSADATPASQTSEAYKPETLRFEVESADMAVE